MVSDVMIVPVTVLTSKYNSLIFSSGENDRNIPSWVTVGQNVSERLAPFAFFLSSTFFCSAHKLDHNNNALKIMTKCFILFKYKICFCKSIS